MSQVVGAVVDPVFGTDISGQKAAKSAQEAALNAQMKMASNQLAANQMYTDKQIQMLTDQHNKSLALQQQTFDYAKAQQDYMNSIVRPSLTAAADYYNNLTTNNYIAQGATALEQAYAQADSRTTQQLATRGISDSGIAANMIMSLNNNLAQSKAALVAGAPGEVAKQRAAFAGQGQHMLILMMLCFRPLLRIWLIRILTLVLIQLMCITKPGLARWTYMELWVMLRLAIT